MYTSLQEGNIWYLQHRNVNIILFFYCATLFLPFIVYLFLFSILNLFTLKNNISFLPFHGPFS